MKKYLNPEIEIIELSSNDIITTSPGTETPSVEETDGIWDLDHWAFIKAEGRTALVRPFYLIK